VLSSDTPILIRLYPVVIIAVALRDWRLAVFLGLWFTMPFLIHSLVLPLKNMRYLLGAIPGLLLAGSVAAVIGASALRRSLANLLARDLLSNRAAHRLASAGVAFAAALIIVTAPAFYIARQVPATGGRIVASVHATEDWRRLSQIVQARDESGELPLGTVDGLAALFYIGRADFVIQRDDLYEARIWAAKRAGEPVPTIKNFDEAAAQGLADFYSGLPVLTRAAALRKRFEKNTAILIVADNLRWASKVQIDIGLKDTLLSEARELCQGECGSLRLYEWPLGN
jgi:hypothetical protein